MSQGHRKIEAATLAARERRSLGVHQAEQAESAGESVESLSQTPT